MGSMITLRIGRLEVDWGKNHSFIDHSSLFRCADLRDADYFYADDIIERKPAFVRRLRDVIPRLELLGFSLNGCRRRYAADIASIPSWYPDMAIDFDTFSKVMQVVDVERVSMDEYGGDFDLGEFAQHILEDPACKDALGRKITREDGTFFENLDPRIALRLLAENPANLDREVIWSIQDVVDGGYVEGNILRPLDDQERFLIVTEGSSDSNILRTALPLIAPDVDDFFSFIDMRDNYPFSGTGSLVNFCKGLAAIRVNNNIVVVLDNDSAGRAAQQKLGQIRMPPNIRIVRLPDLETFRAFPTLGPSGRQTEDVNGRAVAIESFLDLTYGPSEERAVRWTSYNRDVDAYQGELLAKEEYTKQFFANANSKNYDFSKLRLIWQAIFAVCAAEAMPQS